MLKQIQKKEAMQRIRDMDVEHMDVTDNNLGDMDMLSVKLTKMED